jgi:hypothetical protein
VKAIVSVVLLSMTTLAWGQSVNACGASGESFSTKLVHAGGAITAPSAGKAFVYVVEDQGKANEICIDCAVTVKIGFDGTWLGATHGDSFLGFAVDPGEHHLCSNWQSELRSFSKLIALNGFTAESGKVYYFRTHVVVPRDSVPLVFTLEPLNQDEGKLLVDSSRMSESKKKN